MPALAASWLPTNASTRSRAVSLSSATADETSGCAAWATDGPVYVYFDNDADGHAPHDAVSLRRRLDEWVTPDASGRRGYGSAGDRSGALSGDVGW